MAKIDGLEDLIAGLRRTLETAFKRGVSAGEASMRKRILDAAGSAEVPPPAENDPPPKRQGSNGAKSRAPRGTVGKLLKAILSHQPGLKAAEVEARGSEIDNRVTPASFGNELRRYEGKKYRRESDGRWFLKE